MSQQRKANPGESTMKASVFNAWKEDPHLEDVAPPSQPESSSGLEQYVLTKVFSSSVNPIDWKLASGIMAVPGFPGSWPKWVGHDISGEVLSVGSAVTKFKKGDLIYGLATGTYAEKALCHQNSVALKPKNISHNEAAAIPLVALTAWNSMFGSGNLQSGGSVLVLGASGGVGHLAVQLAKAKGAKVLASCGTEKVEYVKSLGADKVVNYREQKLDEVLKDEKVDVVFDTVGAQAERDRAYTLLNRGGSVVVINPIDDTVGDSPVVKIAKGVKNMLWGNMYHFYNNRNLTKIYFLGHSNCSEQLESITKLVEDGKVKVEVAKVYPLSELAEAFQQSKGGKTKGKIVIEVAKE